MNTGAKLVGANHVKIVWFVAKDVMAIARQENKIIVGVVNRSMTNAAITFRDSCNNRCAGIIECYLVDRTFFEDNQCILEFAKRGDFVTIIFGNVDKVSSRSGEHRSARYFSIVI